jgi:uncharacterized coiled-coil DUF342 family protein
MAKRELNQDEQKKKQDYLNNVLTLVESSPDKLNPNEKRLGTKLAEARAAVDKVANEIQTLRNQLQQGEARLRSLELQFENGLGKTTGIAEVLLELHFDSGEDGAASATEETKPAATDAA